MKDNTAPEEAPAAETSDIDTPAAEAPLDYQAASGSGDSQLYQEELKESDEKPEIDSSKTSVAASAKQNLAMMVILGLIVATVVYFMYFRNTSPKAPEVDYGQPTSKPVAASEELSLPSIPDTPPPPADYNLPVAKAPLPLPVATMPTPVLPTAVTPQQQQQQQPNAAKPRDNFTPIPTRSSLDIQQRAQAKMSSGIMLSNGGGGGGKDGKDGKDKSNSPLYHENFVPAHTSSTQQQITRVGNMSLLIAQGKIIESVLETPINTNYPGPIRAIVSADVYSENGNNVLIPRGSRLVGSFGGGYSPGQTRITLTWDRIIMPDGYDIAVASPGIGKSGTAGVEGVVDNQVLPTVTNAVLVSAINVAFAEISSKMTKSNNQSTTTINTNTNGGGPTSTSTSTPTQQAIQQQTSQLGSTLQNMGQQFYTAKPFITLDQGTLVSVFVNKDILFPRNLANNSRIVK